MKRIIGIMVLLLVFFCASGSILVQQTDYNCIPASIEMVYKILGEETINQHDIRQEMTTKYGILPVDEMEEYLDVHFEYESKKVCCEDSLINSIGEHPVLLVLDMQELNMMRDYQGHCLVATDIKETENGIYIKTLDPDGKLERWYPIGKVLDGLKDWNDETYIIEQIKKE